MLPKSICVALFICSIFFVSPQSAAGQPVGIPWTRLGLHVANDPSIQLQIGQWMPAIDNIASQAKWLNDESNRLAAITNNESMEPNDSAWASIWPLEIGRSWRKSMEDDYLQPLSTLVSQASSIGDRIDWQSIVMKANRVRSFYAERIRAAQKALASRRLQRTGSRDYWTYYDDCDRWDVLLAVAHGQPIESPPASVMNQPKQSVDFGWSNFKKRIDHAMDEFGNLLQQVTDQANRLIDSLGPQVLLLPMDLSI